MHLSFLFPLTFVLLLLLSPATATGVFRVRHKFGPGRATPLADLHAHDARRHPRILSAVDLNLGSKDARRHPRILSAADLNLGGKDARRRPRILSAVDLNLGGKGSPADTGLYYAEIGIGTPPKNYYVQVDTGSDIMWVNCASCTACPHKSDIKIELTQYDLKGSNSGNRVMCNQGFCTSMFGTVSKCDGTAPCQFKIGYGDGSETTGFFVSDVMQYNRVTGNHETSSDNATVTFGCATQLSGDLVSQTEALDGILGFGQSNSSMISQLAASGKARKIFAHCLDSMNGGGIFAIGHVVQPKVNTTPLVPNMPHYNVNLKSIDVGGIPLQLPTSLFANGANTGTIIDSGTTLGYLPDPAYNQLMDAIFSSQPTLKVARTGQFSCFRYSKSVDDGFPSVTFHFENALLLSVYPHDYLFRLSDNLWCVGWQASSRETSFLLGDILLSNKLVVYDLEKQVIGWTDYNCSGGIKVEGDRPGEVYTVDAHSISSADIVETGGSMILFLVTAAFYMFWSFGQ